MKKRFNKGDTLELLIEDLTFGARGIAHLDDFAWFVEHGIPGQKVKAIIKRIKKNYGEARVIEVLKPSPYQVDSPCPYFGICGGCKLQHLRYDIQIEAKTRQVQDILERISNIRNFKVSPTLPSENIYEYRNKMEFSFSDQRWIIDNEIPGKQKDFALGLHVPQRFDKVLDIDVCLLQSERANRVLKDIKNLVLETGLRSYSTKTHTGFWRFLVIREGKNTGDLMVNFVTSTQESENGSKAIELIGQKLSQQHPEISSVLHSTTDRKAQVAFGESERLLSGTRKITEKIGNRLFEISPDAFFQTNTYQAKHLFDTIAELADFKDDEIVYDLYCGTGAIGISIADKVKKVIGIEVIESAIEDAKRNAELNKISNIDFISADMKNVIRENNTLTERYGYPDVVILDPPRGGTHPKTITDLLKLSSPKIVYVSCNPPILARDLIVLCENDYELKIVQPIDMFPHTGHIEVVALLMKKDPLL